MDSRARDFKGLSDPPPYSSGHQDSTSKVPIAGGLFNDPRTSSTQSLTPSLPAYEEVERRKLLVIYIHGFMGNDTSFQSFPAHVHKYLKETLSDSHVVHSKIYPRYKTYKSIDIARDNFSTWLEPLENPKTDVVLVGHSMGGLLAAGVVLKPSTHHNRHSQLQHRILGVVNLDAPLLGMHPGIIVAGLSSLFRKDETPKLPGETSTQSALSPGVTGLPSPSLSAYSVPSTLSEALPSPPPPPPAPFTRPALTNDANFNPNFANDVRIEERTWWKNVVHFVKKHNSEGLIDAAANHVMSHLEFGGTMFEINNLKSRYESVRRLEDVDDLNPSNYLPRVRFIQYYTICNGFPKKPKEGDAEQEDAQQPISNYSLEKNLSSPQIAMDSSKSETQYRDSKQELEPLSLSNSERSSLELLSPEPMLDEPPPIPARDGPVDIVDDRQHDSHADSTQTKGQDDTLPPTEEIPVEDKVLTADITQAVAALDIDLPAIADLPPKPEEPNFDNFTDKDARKLAEKEAKRAQKAYAQAVKDREKAIKEREKIIEKRKKKLAQEAEKKQKEEQKKQKEEEKKRKKDETAAAAKATTTASENPDASPSTSSQKVNEKSPVPKDEESAPPEWTPVPPTREDTERSKEKKKGKEKAKEKEKGEKQRKFCNVPKSNGRVDSKWIGIFMKDMDQVAAHTSLFFAGEHYERLVGDVGNIIAEWVHEDMTRRAVLELR